MHPHFKNFSEHFEHFLLISDDEEEDHEPEEGDVGAEEDHEDIKDPICIEKKDIEHETKPPEKEEEEEEEVPNSGIETE